MLPKHLKRSQFFGEFHLAGECGVSVRVGPLGDFDDQRGSRVVVKLVEGFHRAVGVEQLAHVEECQPRDFAKDAIRRDVVASESLCPRFGDGGGDDRFGKVFRPDRLRRLGAVARPDRAPFNLPISSSLSMRSDDFGRGPTSGQNQHRNNHSWSFVHRLLDPWVRTAMANALRCPTMTTRRLPRVTAV